MISIKIDTGNIDRLLGDQRKRARRCAAIALTKTADYAKMDLAGHEFGKVFDRPTNFTSAAGQTVAATPSKLTAEVKFKPRQAKYLAPEVAGGARRSKAFERALTAAGWLPNGYMTVPGEGAPLDAFGNIPRSFLVAIMRQLGNGGGYGGAKAGDTKKQARDVRRVGQFFVVPVGSRAGRDASVIKQPGVYQAVRSAFGMGIRPVLIFIRQARYQQRLNLKRVAENAIAARLQSAFQEAWRT